MQIKVLDERKLWAVSSEMRIMKTLDETKKESKKIKEESRKNKEIIAQ